MESRPAHMPATSLVDRLMDNSNRRQYGMGIVGRMTRFLLARLALSAPLAWPGLHSFKGRHELDVSSKLISFIGKKYDSLPRGDRDQFGCCARPASSEGGVAHSSSPIGLFD